MEFLNQNYILYAGLIQSISRGTADILEEGRQGVFLRDTVSDAYMLAVEDPETGKRWLKAHEYLKYELIVVFRRELFIGIQNGETVGFAGLHLEGSMGLLKILPMYRRKGYGAALENYLIVHMLKKGLIPFCQVESDNRQSLDLQKKLGLTISEEHTYWLF